MTSAEKTNQQIEEAKRLKHLQELGKQGLLWGLEIYYQFPEIAQEGHFLLSNLTGEQVEKLREQIFKIGFNLPVDPGHWRIVMPSEILRAELWRQSKYFG